MLARREFSAPRKAGPLEWLGRQWSELKQSFWDVVERIRVLEVTAPVVYWLILGWMVLSVLAIAAHLAISIARAWRARDRHEAEGRGDGLAGGARPRTPAAWEAEARRLADAGRLREAAVALYQALLLRLDARGVVRYDPAKTPGEYRREARRDAAGAAALGAFLRAFEPVAFGGRALDRAGYERLRSAGDGGPRG